MTFGLTALLGLVLTVVLLSVPGGVLFAPLTFALFLFGLAGVLLGSEDRTVRQRGGVVKNPERWRGGSEY